MDLKDQYTEALNLGWNGLSNSDDRAKHAISLAVGLPKEIALAIAENEFEKHLKEVNQSKSVGSGHVGDNFMEHIKDLETCDKVVQHFRKNLE